MKKALAFALALFMLCGAALATSEIMENNGTATTDVTYQVELCDEFTLTIPPEINLSAPQTAPGIAEGSMQIVLNPRKINIPGFVIKIKLKEPDSGFVLTSGSNEIPYVISYNYLPDENGVFFRWECPEHDLNTDTARTILVESTTIPEDMPSGVYTDVLTFIVEVVDPREPPTA